MKTLIIPSVSAFLLVSTFAFAQSSGGVEISGDATIDATAEDITTTGENNSTASTAVGNVRGSTDIDGDVEMSLSVKGVTTTAKNNSCAETAIGVIGDGPCTPK